MNIEATNSAAFNNGFKAGFLEGFAACQEYLAEVLGDPLTSNITFDIEDNEERLNKAYAEYLRTLPIAQEDEEEEDDDAPYFIYGMSR
jgi:hypothetical protein